MVPDDKVRHLAVAPDTVLLQECRAGFPDLDRFMEILEGKGDGMVNTVIRLRNPLRDGTVRYMAVIAGRHGMVRGFAPTIVLVAHNVAVNACFGIVEKVGCTLRIDQRVSACADAHTHKRKRSNY
jgi:hypothetical protein